MSQFIKIKNNLINVDKVTNFELVSEEIWVYFEDSPSDPLNIVCTGKYEAKAIFEDIPHLIDNTHIPQWVREEVHEPIPCKSEYFNLDYDYDELPF